MANICDTQYKVMGERKAVADLWNTLQTMEVNTKNVYLYKLAEHYGIDYEKMGISSQASSKGSPEELTQHSSGKKPCSSWT